MSGKRQREVALDHGLGLRRRGRRLRLEQLANPVLVLHRAARGPVASVLQQRRQLALLVELDIRAERGGGNIEGRAYQIAADAARRHLHRQQPPAQLLLGVGRVDGLVHVFDFLFAKLYIQHAYIIVYLFYGYGYFLEKMLTLGIAQKRTRHE